MKVVERLKKTKLSYEGKATKSEKVMINENLVWFLIVFIYLLIFLLNITKKISCNIGFENKHF